MSANISRMSYGNIETSYANNSDYQKTVILQTRSILKDALKKLYNEKEGFPKCFKMADLGCAFGSNVFMPLSEIVGTIYGLCQNDNTKAPEFQIYLNDLPENDFNSVFKLIPDFCNSLVVEKGLKFGSCFIAGLPGSFYGRLFPRKSLHFVHSSFSLHWLSQLPENLVNKGNAYISKTNSQEVFEAYLQQFQRDFTTFLRLRSKEIISGGRMVLTFVARNDADFTVTDACIVWGLFTKALLDMVSEGRVQEKDVDTFNMPHFTPCIDEVKGLILEEGSFNIEILEIYEYEWDAKDKKDTEDFEFDNHRSGANLARILRAFTEPLLVSHFGEFGLDELFKKFSEHFGNYLAMGETKPKSASITVSLSRK